MGRFQDRAVGLEPRQVRDLRVCAGEAVMLKNQRRHNTVTSAHSGHFDGGGK